MPRRSVGPLALTTTLLFGCAAVDLEADEPVASSCCDDPETFGLPDDPAELARWDQAGAAITAHRETLGRIFDETCPRFDLTCLPELERRLQSHASRTKRLNKTWMELWDQRCGYFDEAYDLIGPAKPSRDLVIRLLRGSQRNWPTTHEAVYFIAGVSRISCCVTLDPGP